MEMEGGWLHDNDSAFMEYRVALMLNHHTATTCEGVYVA
jgi:hypothetical protein